MYYNTIINKINIFLYIYYIFIKNILFITYSINLNLLAFTDINRNANVGFSLFSGENLFSPEKRLNFEK
jgi:hypothetical protein